MDYSAGMLHFLVKHTTIDFLNKNEIPSFYIFLVLNETPVPDDCYGSDGFGTGFV